VRSGNNFSGSSKMVGKCTTWRVHKVFTKVQQNLSVTLWSAEAKKLTTVIFYRALITRENIITSLPMSTRALCVPIDASHEDCLYWADVKYRRDMSNFCLPHSIQSFIDCRTSSEGILIQDWHSEKIIGNDFQGNEIAFFIHLYHTSSENP
jgi:hypothetical protein